MKRRRAEMRKKIDTNMEFYSACVGWPRQDVDAPGGLCDMVAAAQKITRQTFLRHVDREQVRDLEAQMGYDTGNERGGLRMSNDWAVNYHRSKLHGKWVYYIRQSG